MTFITDLADQAVVLPLVLAIGIALLAQGWRRGAAAWAVAVVATFAAMLAMKLIFLACSHSFGNIDIRTPSGHVAAATVVTGGLAALLLRRRASVLPLAALAAIVVGVSRLATCYPRLCSARLWGWPVRMLCRCWQVRCLRGSMCDALPSVRRQSSWCSTDCIFPAEAHILAVCQSGDVRL